MFIEPQDPEFYTFWEILYRNSSFISPLYSKRALDYYRQRPLDESKEIIDCSFVYVKENVPCASLILAKVKKDDRVDLLAYEAPGTSLANEDLLSRKDIVNINTRIDSVLNGLNGEFTYRDYLDNGYINFITRRFLSLGCIPYSAFSSIIDLKLEHEYLHQKIRKSYKSLINWGKKNLKIELYDYKNITAEEMENFKNLHIYVSGRRTRSDESWAIQLEMIQNNEAFLVIGFLDGKIVTGSFFMYSGSVCYYGVSASIREMFDKPLSHALVWKAVQYAKDSGYSYFEMGEQKYIGNPKETDIDDKNLAISDFKAGFGGDIRVFIDLTLNNYRKKSDPGSFV
ncbi:hypothetical protein [Marispirochaeta aestuarii]|uniref:hypothetical protein n=1 Tax=Marispirochaeta aestuarii TaxID=1963862 RepID=UPI0029C67224|nr:hypothetical protein [Marispirochaeta aestuarii]